MAKKNEIVTVKRLKRGKLSYYRLNIVANGIDLLRIIDDKAGVDITFNKSMSKELFRKLKKLKTFTLKNRPL